MYSVINYVKVNMTYKFYIEFLHEKILSPEILGPSKLEK